MSLIFLCFLIGVGFIFIIPARNYANKGKEDFISKGAMNILFYYMFALFCSPSILLGLGLSGYLQQGSWLSITPYYLIMKLDEANFIRELMLSESSSIVINNLSSWYFQQSIGWSCILTLLIIYITLQFEEFLSVFKSE